MLKLRQMKKLSSVKVEGKYGHGSIHVRPLLRKWYRFRRHSYKKLLVGASPVNWNQTFMLICGAVKNQGTSDSCSGMAGSYFLETAIYGGKVMMQEISAKSIYAPIAYQGGGTLPNDLETQIAARGANLESLVPDVAPDGTCTEAWMSDKNWTTPDVIQEATTRAGWTPSTVPINMDSIAQTLISGNPVIIALKGQNGNTPNWLSLTPQPPSPYNSNEVWEHFVLVIGFTTYQGQPYLIFQNSWGTGVGNNGLQYLSQDYVDTAVVDAFTFIRDSQLVPTNNTIKSNVWVWLWDYFTGNKLQPAPSPS